MDGHLLGMIGAIAGTVLGALGGLVGTYRGFKNCEGPKERRLLFRLVVLTCAGVGAFLGVLVLVPFEWRLALWPLSIPGLIWFVVRSNSCLAHTRAEDRADAGFAAMDGGS